MPRPNQRETVLNAARDLILRDGFAQTSVRAIASAAGLTTGAIYSNFSGKPEILGILLLEVWDRVGVHVNRELEQPAGRSRLRCLYAGYRHFASSEPAAFQLLVHFSLHPELADALEDPLASTIHQRQQERFDQALLAVRADQAEGLLPPGDPRLLLAAFSAITDGLMVSRGSQFYRSLGVDADAVETLAEKLFFMPIKT
jgi:AcrR family transcriptional regulator